MTREILLRTWVRVHTYERVCVRARVITSYVRTSERFSRRPVRRA